VIKPSIGMNCMISVSDGTNNISRPHKNETLRSELYHALWGLGASDLLGGGFCFLEYGFQPLLKTIRYIFLGFSPSAFIIFLKRLFLIYLFLSGIRNSPI